MSTGRENISDVRIDSGGKNFGAPMLSRILNLLSSVRLGVVLLCLLALACLIGMLIMQQTVEGFDNYYATLTPAQRLVYGGLGFFDIYHSWYFNVLLGVLSLNIILASIDRFPKTWLYASKPQVTVPLRWLIDQKDAEVFNSRQTRGELVKNVSSLLTKSGWQRIRISEKNDRTHVLAESGIWNRFAFYAVHISLLTIFTGGFLTAQLGNTGNLPLSPGESSNMIFETVADLDQVNQITKRLPFDVAFTDIEQKLIRKEGSLDASNTIDWITRFAITDETGTHEAMVQMNRPFDYRGYRFFQASFTPVGRARSITLDVAPGSDGPAQRIIIARDGVVTLADGTRIRFYEFRGNFRVGPDDKREDTSDYPNPGAILQIVPPGGTVQTAYAFGSQMASMPVAGKPVGGYTYKLIDFEKVSDQHVLSVQFDPGANVVYLGFVLLFLTLVGVFFFSHQRVWVVLEELAANRTRITTAGDTNRSRNAFEEKFRRFVTVLRTETMDRRAT